jgi:hypothetical protein
MDEPGSRSKRRIFRWPEEAKVLIASYLKSNKGYGRKRAVTGLATSLIVLTGYPRDACLRFLHRQGVTQKRNWRPWTKPEQQRLLNLMETCPVDEAAKIMQRSPRSIRSMLHRLGETSQRGRDWFTPYSLADALHVRVEEVQRWIANGWLKCRTVETTGLKKRIIEADDFSDFVKQHGPAVVGRRLSAEGLLFVRTFVFPPKHAHLLPLRKSKDMAEPGIEAADDGGPEIAQGA